MAPKSLSLPFAILSILVASFSFQASAAPLGGRKATPLGGWQPINNPKDPRVVKIASLAVAEHNRQAKAALEFVSVVDGKIQTSGAVIYYKLVISAKDGGKPEKPNNYEAVVYEDFLDKFLRLISFKKLLQY